MNRITTYIIVIIVVAASVGGAYGINRYYFKEENDVEEPDVVVEEGDQVTAHYTGWLEDERIYEGRRVFDSSREVDQDTILTFSERERGDPFQFTVDNEEVIDGWAEEVVGMTEGETKTFTVPPEKAYPEWSEDLIYEVDREETLPVYEELDKEAFSEKYGGEPQMNMVVRDEFWNWDKTVVDIGGEMVTMMHDPVVGETYRTYIEDSQDWTTEVISIDSSEDIIEVQHEVEKPALVDAAHIGLHQEEFLRVEERRSNTGQSPGTTGIVVDISEETITIDFNEEVNNKALTFKMEILKVQKGGETSETS
ncbi:MAG: FKBP-type peptidyl-prolyl cis-trans isomerase [Candidatus Saliniplasma sp.]